MVRDPSAASAPSLVLVAVADAMAIALEVLALNPFMPRSPGRMFAETLLLCSGSGTSTTGRAVASSSPSRPQLASSRTADTPVEDAAVPIEAVAAGVVEVGAAEAATAVPWMAASVLPPKVVGSRAVWMEAEVAAGVATGDAGAPALEQLSAFYTCGTGKSI